MHRELWSHGLPRAQLCQASMPRPPQRPPCKSLMQTSCAHTLCAARHGGGVLWSCHRNGPCGHRSTGGCMGVGVVVCGCAHVRTCVLPPLCCLNLTPSPPDPLRRADRPLCAVMGVCPGVLPVPVPPVPGAAQLRDTPGGPHVMPWRCSDMSLCCTTTPRLHVLQSGPQVTSQLHKYVVALPAMRHAK